MSTTEPLRDAYHNLEAGLDALAVAFAQRGTVAHRAHLGTVCLTAQLLAASADMRFDFRDDRAPESTGYDALRLHEHDGTLTVECRPENTEHFSDALGWGCFDTLSKLLILEGLEAAANA